MGSEFIELEQIVANEARHDIVAGARHSKEGLRLRERGSEKHREREDQRNRERERITEIQREDHRNTERLKQKKKKNGASTVQCRVYKYKTFCTFHFEGLTSDLV